MKFEFGFSGPGRRNLIIGLVALVVIASIVAIIIRYQSRSTYQFPPAAGDTTNGTSTLTNAIAVCTTNYRTAIAQGLSDSTPSKTICVQNAVDAYFTTKCPFVTTGTVPPLTDTVATTAYNQYTGIGAGITPVGGDAAAVTSSTQYINLVNSVPTGLTSAIVTRARKADLTGPTRKYIESACPNFYKPADSTGSDFTTVYKAWRVAPATSTLPTTAGEFGFYAPSVTTASVTTWASYAATPITVTLATAVDAAVTTTKTLTVTGTFPTALSNAKVKVTGITGVVTGTATASSSSIALTYPSQIVPIIAAGTAINMSTASAISSVTFASGAAVPIPNTTSTPTTAISTVRLTLGSALDNSLVVGSQVLISGSTISGQVTISTISADRLTIEIGFTSQVFPILPTGTTIESIVETPYATPLVSTSIAYNKIGTMSGQKMFNWQIAQVVGPGTYWNSTTAGTSAIVWGV